MLTTAVLILAQGGENTAEAPDGGVGAGIIALVVLGVVLMAALLFLAFHKLSKSSRGGVEPRPGEFRRGDPPFESVGRKR